MTKWVQYRQHVATFFANCLDSMKRKPHGRIRVLQLSPLNSDAAARLCVLQDGALGHQATGEGEHAEADQMSPVIMYSDLDLQELHGALGYFYDFTPDDRLLCEILDRHPTLVGEAQEWGWDDTEVRGKAAGLVSERLIGRQWPTYGETETHAIDIKVFHQEVQDAHDRWVTEHDRT